MTHIFYLIVPFSVKFLFEGEDDQHFVDVRADLLNPVLLPGPDLWRYIINNTKSLLACPFGDAKVESRVVDQDEGIGGIFKNIRFAEVNVAEDGAEVHQHFCKAHEGEVLVVFDQVASGLLHQVAAPAADVGRRGLLFQLFDEIAAVEVTGRLTCDDVILHEGVKIQLK